MTGYLVLLGEFILCVAYVWRGYYDCKRRHNELDAEIERMKLMAKEANECIAKLIEENNKLINDFTKSLVEKLY